MRKGFTLVEIMIVVSIIALLSAIAIPNLLRARMTANESAAQSTLRTISVAIETFASANGGAFPTTEAELTAAAPPYLNRAYQGLAVQGYNYTYPTFTATAYCLQAAPTAASTGTNTFSIRTGGVLVTAACT